ncbi:ABC transporter ATP-binding protein [Enterococcus sp. LJL51]|uniref:ABC transporter ATP-binding protein n=1 Tax=Enterococcus sp. LJL51 TaxID=3416656 RepID=UPI003CF09BA0
MMTKKTPTQSLKKILPYLLYYRCELILSILLGAVSGFATVWMTDAFGKAVDTMIGEENVDFSKLYAILGLLLGILIVTVISQWLIQLLGNRVSYLSVARLRKDTFSKLNELPLNYYDQQAHGDIVSRFTNDMDNISIACSVVFNQLFSGVAVVLIALVFMVRLSVTLTIVVLVTTPIIFIVNWLVANASQKNFAAQQKIVGSISGFVSEMVGNQKIVKAFRREAHVQTQFEQLNQELYVEGQKAQFSSSLTNPLSRFVDHLSYIAIGLTGGLLILSGNTAVSVGVISSFTIYSAQFSKPFIELSGMITQIQTAIAGIDRSFDLLEEQPEKPDEKNAFVLTKAKGDVSFNHVYFSYIPDKPLIEDFSLTVQEGETVAIVGKTGAGKSTLVNLLMRFYDVDQGSITVDEHSIAEITRDSLRKSFGMVLQDTWLFDGTLRENLTYGNPQATASEIKTALEKTHTAEFIQRLPKGLETEIGSQGIKISEGQRQLLTIARTMISNPPMLILDEATSSVDTLTEKQIQSAFLEIMKGRTSFVIAHRLSTIKNADKILVMEQGKIVEIGDHRTLLTIPNGHYQALYNAQFAKQS